MIKQYRISIKTDAYTNETAQRAQDMYVQLLYNKESKNIQWVKDNFFNKWCWKIGQPHAKE